MHDLSVEFESLVLKSTGAVAIEGVELIQGLWSGYGKILRLGLLGGEVSTVVVKHVRMPGRVNHPRGWSSDRSHERKVKSYEVEAAWYKDWGMRCGEGCRIPRCLGWDSVGGELLMVLEDLDAAGYAGRRGSLSWHQVEVCLRWLANFHATFMGVRGEGLWETGTYWHLETRPDELAVMDDVELRDAAAAIDGRLKQAVFQTLVHGDAKLANFCFSADGLKVAAVDFQYVGGGCGMKDVAYFVGSCLGEGEAEARESEVLDGYFKALREALAGSECDVDGVEVEWRELYPVAWTDFHRFLKGWSPGHWKINSYSERLAKEVVGSLQGL